MKTLLFILLLLLHPLASADVLIQQLVDPPSTLSPAFFDALNSASTTQNFGPERAKVIRPEVGKRSLWRIKLGENPALIQHTAVLMIGQTLDRTVALYFPPGFEAQRLSLLDAHYQSTLSREAIVVPIPPNLRAGDYFWLELENPRSVAIDLALRDASEQAQINLNNVRFYTAMMVLMLACCGIAACFYFILRESIWLLYILKVLGYWVYVGSRTNELASIADGAALHPWVPFLGINLGNAAAMFAAGVSAFFFVRFLQLELYAPKLRKTILIVGCLMLAIAPFALMAPTHWWSKLVQLANLLLVSNAIFVVAACVFAIKSGSRTALYYLIADSLLLTTLGFQVASGLGWTEYPELSNRWFLAAHAFSGLIISLGLAHQVLGYRQQRDEAISNSERDPLTGALNRRAANQALESALRTLERGRGSVCVCFLDLDLFKRVNDSFGHHVGDDALKFLVQEIEMEIRGGDLLARLGGEEFILVLPGAHLKDGLALAERVRNRVEQNGVQISGKPVKLTVSIGVAASTSSQNTADELIDAADRALYRAKSNGRNRVEAMNVVEFKTLRAG